MSEHMPLGALRLLPPGGLGPDSVPGVTSHEPVQPHPKLATAGRPPSDSPIETDAPGASRATLALVEDTSDQAEEVRTGSSVDQASGNTGSPRSNLHAWSANVWPTALFWSAVVLVAVFRYVVLASGGAPGTVDGGNWIAFGERIFGGHPRDDSIVYPPFVPILTYLTTSLFGVVTGIALVGALSALAPGLGMYYALRLAGLGRERVFPAILLIGAGSVGEAAAWGGFPQLIGLGLLPIAMILGLRYLDDPTRWSGLRLGVVMMTMLAVTHFLAIVMLVALAVSSLGALARSRRSGWFRRVLRTTPWVLLPSLWLVPVYVRLVDAVIFNPNEFTALDNLTASNALGRLDLIYSDFPALWEAILPLSLMTPLLAWGMRRDRVWRLLVSLLAAVATMLAITQESRYLYLAPLVGALGVALWLSRLDELGSFLRERSAPKYLGAVGLGVLAVLGVAQVRGGLSTFGEYRDFYGVMTPDILDAIDAVDDYSDDPGVVLVPSLGDAPIGWWVEALTGGEVLYGSPLRWLNFPNEIERARVANSVFDPSFPDSDTMEQLEDAAVDVMLVPTRWAWFDDEAIRDWIEAEGLLLLLANDDALVIALP